MVTWIGIAALAVSPQTSPCLSIIYSPALFPRTRDPPPLPVKKLSHILRNTQGQALIAGRGSKPITTILFLVCLSSRLGPVRHQKIVSPQTYTRRSLELKPAT